jgi:hypothetical protein
MQTKHSLVYLTVAGCAPPEAIQHDRDIVANVG